jgi:prevent-host-death family protein
MRVGVRELKNHATEILRQVREDRARFVVTYYGQPVALLLPIDEDWLADETERAAQAASPGEEIATELEVVRRGRQAKKAASEFVWE